MINLRSGLVVPRAPRCCAVNGDDRALVTGDDHSFRIVGINPELVIIIAARRAFDRRPSLPSVSRAIDGGIHYVDDVGVLRIDIDLLEILTTVPQALVTR